MFSKNLRYYRLRKSMSKKDLASITNLTPMAITNYENGARTPNMETLKALAAALGVRVSDFLAVRNQNLVFKHGEFRKNTSVGKSKQEYIKESAEEYFGRFMTTVELIGGEVLPKAPDCNVLNLSGDVEEDAKAMRIHLGVAPEGPIKDLVAILENKGILIYYIDIDDEGFSGMNGFINDRPYIIINNSITPQRIRSTIAHELAHLFFIWPSSMDNKEAESTATAISGAFLFPQNDARRELGIRRNYISSDIMIVCEEYGISMQLLVKRAEIVGIISKEVEKGFYIQMSKKGWRKKEPLRGEKETPKLFEQLVYRAVSEKDISISKGAELLQKPYAEIAEHIMFSEDDAWN